MSANTSVRPLHPLHAILLGFPIALFTTALATDITYLNTAEMQWSNFSSWLITGALLFGGPAVLWTAISTFRTRQWLFLLLLGAMWLLGLVNAFKHSADAWASVGTTGLLLSAATASLALAAGWVGFAGKVR